MKPAAFNPAVVRALLLIMLAGISCRRDAPEEVKPLSVYTIPVSDTLPSLITENTVMTRGRNWYISGLVFVVNNATLRIDSGTIIRMLHMNADYPASGLIITRGAGIMAQGSRQYPIRFVIADSALYRPTAWNGIILLGKAPVRRSGAALHLHPWSSYSLAYGGNDPADSSGRMEEVKLETGTNRPGNGLQQLGTGNRTVVRNVQVFAKGLLQLK